jgi:hypothetical protein
VLELEDDFLAERVPSIRILERIQLVQGVPEAWASTEVEAFGPVTGVGPCPLVEEPGQLRDAPERDGGLAVEPATGRLDERAQRSLGRTLRRVQIGGERYIGNLMPEPTPSG